MSSFLNVFKRTFAKKITNPNVIKQVLDSEVDDRKKASVLRNYVVFGGLDQDIVKKYLTESKEDILLKQFLKIIETEPKCPYSRPANQWDDTELDYYNVHFANPIHYKSLFDFELQLTTKASNFISLYKSQSFTFANDDSDINKLHGKSLFFKSLFHVIKSENYEANVERFATNLFSNVFEEENIDIFVRNPFILNASGGECTIFPDMVLPFYRKKPISSILKPNKGGLFQSDVQYPFYVVEIKPKVRGSIPKAQAQALAELVAVSETYGVKEKALYFLIIKGAIVKIYRAKLSTNFMKNVKNGIFCPEITRIDSCDVLSCNNVEELTMIVEMLCGIQHHYMNYF